MAGASQHAGRRPPGWRDGVGELGTAALRQLQALGFECGGWSRTPHVIAGVACWHGPQQLAEFLARTDILICLLPLTDATRGLLNAELFDALPKGAMLIQAGRGPQLHPHHLLAALESGQVQAAILDVTDPEPLPPSIHCGDTQVYGSRRISPARRKATARSAHCWRTSGAGSAVNHARRY